MAPKTKPKAKKKGKLKPAKKSVSTLKTKRSMEESTSRLRNRDVTSTKKILRRPKKSIRRSKPTPRKQRSTVEESTPSSLEPSTVYESQEVTAFGSEVDENGSIASSIASSPDENKEKQDTGLI